ncbi:rhodanese-like domain-containing protein [Parendozoicomonas haliclonae]|uniref:rhodanese-like domain-containing protein n=1 Tax=Parendozoicomonas haliclonae TaxID=1960125 RepID=UPI0039F0E37F
MSRLLPVLVFACSLAGPTVSAEESSMKTLDLSRVENLINAPDWVLVDARLSDAFNGWKLDGIARGGHLPGAVDFPANWLTVDDEAREQKLRAVLAGKGISTDKSVLLYDVNGKDARKVAEFLQTQGFHNLHYFNLKPWIDNPSLALVKWPGYQRVVPAEAVKAVLDGKQPESFENAGKVKILEASWGDEDESYSKGHIPTAVHVNTDLIEPMTTLLPPMWPLAEDSSLLKTAQSFGLTRDDTVIVTGEEPLAAYRVASILEYLGVKDVRILNGGTRAWERAGYALETQSHDPVPGKGFGADKPLRPEVIDTLPELQTKLTDKQHFTLVDNRTREEYLGESSGYSYHLKKGRIPGAVHGFAGEGNSYSMSHFRNIDGTMRNPREVLALWKAQNIDLNDALAFMCGSGWRAAEVYFYAEVAGLKNISIFSDGWIGWSNAGLPTLSGEPGQGNKKG